ncbi:hypothetical protein PAXINDRAFT_19976 [Paxillus involutus ATCC 200175]|uniref:Uncharacterized protein n=1 Tax=Paxillus involutus ATCC 200175 TaxID=664439 RepID=A0A0C9THL4_PAXIN|nr:hypothetical protein PAXINDRAFT_19976 [Paxillus involutus ATCC 200175]
MRFHYLPYNPMPECPNCWKQFATDTGVTHHLSQPLTSCQRWQDDLIAIADVLTRDQQSTSLNLEHSDAHEDPPPPSNDLDVSVDTSDLEQLTDLVMGESHSNLPSDGLDQTDHMAVDEDEESEFAKPPGGVEYFPDAAKVLAQGETFLDRFELNPYSAQ